MMGPRFSSTVGVAAALVLALAATAYSKSAGSTSKSSAVAPQSPSLAAATAAAARGSNAASVPGAAAAQAAPGTVDAAGGGVPDSSGGAATAFDRKIIRNADLGIVVEDVQAAAGSVTSIATGLSGYVAASNLSQSGDKLRGTLTVRVPATAFDQAFTQIQKLGLKVQRENISSQDVTQEYTDLDARVKNLEATADQLRQLLSTVREKTNDTNQILTVYRELSNITGQIEQAKGRQQYLGKLSELATLSVELIPQDAKLVPPPPNKSAWNPGRTLRDAITVLASAGKVGVELLIWTGVFVLPLALAIALVVVAVLAGRRLRALRRATGAP